MKTPQNWPSTPKTGIKAQKLAPAHKKISTIWSARNYVSVIHQLKCNNVVGHCGVGDQEDGDDGLTSVTILRQL